MVGAAAIGFVPSASSAPPRSACPASPHVWTHGAWTMLDRPRQLASLRGAAVDVARPDTVYVTDGRRIARSTTRGCSWQLVLDLADRGGSSDGPTGAEITSLVVPRPGRIYATVAKANALPGTPIEPVMMSFDGGRSWETAAGLPAIRPSRLRASPADPDVMYLSMHTGPIPAATIRVNSIDVGHVWSFFASTDGGRSWTRASTGQHRGRFVPDPADPTVVWSLGSETAAFDGPYRSADGGVTWAPTPGQPANDLEHADLDVFRTRGRPAHVVVAQGEGGQQQAPAMAVYVSSDDGRTFRDLPAAGLAGRVGSVAFGRSPAEIVISSQSGVYRFLEQAAAWRDVDLLNLAPLMDATRIARAEPSWWFWRPELVAVYREAAPLRATPPSRVIPPPPVACPGTREFSAAQPGRVPGASLEVVDDPIALDPSFASRADFRLSLPAVPSRLDTYFLLDTSASMGGAIDGVVCGLERLVHDLNRAGVDGHFGLGEFQDANGLRYRRLVDITPPGFELQSALRTRRLQGGEEPHRGALYQTATGAGLRGAAGEELIRPRQAATYRTDALRVVLLVTDEPYQATTTYEPTVLQVINALRGRNIHHIGIHVRSEDASPVNATGNDALTRRQLEEFSRGTRTFAPEGGVDCDGDGSADVPPGAPLVCTVDRDGIEANLAETLTAVLLAVREDGIARLRPAHTAGMRVEVPEQRRIDVRDDHTGQNTLVFPANITCTPRQAGTRHTLVMAADVSGREVTRTPFRVTCGAPPQSAAGGRHPLAAIAPPPALAPAAVPAAEPVLSSSVTGSFATNPVSAPGVTLRGEMPGVVALAPEERESGVETIKFSDAAAVRVLGAGALLGAFVLLELQRRSARRLSKVGRRR